MSKSVSTYDPEAVAGSMNRAMALSDAYGDYFTEEKIAYLLKKIPNPRLIAFWLYRAWSVLEETTFEAGEVEQALRALANELNIEPKVFFPLLRLAITGEKNSPPLFDVICVLGKQRVVDRLSVAQNNAEAYWGFDRA